MIFSSEVSYCIYLLCCNNLNLKLQKYSDACMNWLLVLYLLVKCMTVGDIDERTRQETLGMALLVLLMLMVMTCLVLIVGAIVALSWTIFRNFKKGKVAVLSRQLSNEHVRLKPAELHDSPKKISPNKSSSRISFKLPGQESKQELADSQAARLPEKKSEGVKIKKMQLTTSKKRQFRRVDNSKGKSQEEIHN